MIYNKSKLLFKVVALFILSATITFREAESFDFGQVFGVVKDQFVTDRIDFLGYECQYDITPTFRSWELHFKTKMWCPGVVPFSGRGLGKSKSGSVKDATRDFAKKALNSGLFTREELEHWI